MAHLLSGMTGFGRGVASGEAGEISVEARSVNGKGLDIRLRQPYGFEAFENEIRQAIKSVFNRGSVSVNIQVSDVQSDLQFSLDETALKLYAKASETLVDQGLADRPRADGLLSLKGVIVSEDDGNASKTEALKPLVLAALNDALNGLVHSRQEEGHALGHMLEQYLSEIETLLQTACNLASAQPESIRDKLKAKLEELLPEGFDDDRLTQEAAALAVKADVREELDRLNAHIDAARKLISGGSPCGRKLDFLSQEFNREANTLCSKSSDKEMTETGLALKAVIDQMREQVQNVE